MEGTITYYSRRGYGFIEAPELGRELFFHCKELPDTDRRRFDLQGKRASFDLGQRDGKPVAVNVRIVDAPPDAIQQALAPLGAKGGA